MDTVGEVVVDMEPDTVSVDYCSSTGLEDDFCQYTQVLINRFLQATFEATFQKDAWHWKVGTLRSSNYIVGGDLSPVTFLLRQQQNSIIVLINTQEGRRRMLKEMETAQGDLIDTTLDFFAGTDFSVHGRCGLS